MSFWRSSDNSIRWLVVIGLVQLLIAANDLYKYGPASLRWMVSLSFAVTCLVLAPLAEEPSRRDLPLRQQLRTPNGLLFVAAFVVLLALWLWSLIESN